MHGVLGGAKCGASLEYDLSQELTSCAVPYVRTRGAFSPYGLNQYLDIHCIFPDMTRDASDESSYNFLPTDEYLKAIKASGAEIFLCLGESADYFPRKLYIRPCGELSKIAEICTNIIAHYNEGWANGYKLAIKYCEIYPGADNPCCFDGSREEYFLLYSTVSRALRQRFPKLKLGAYSCGGFRSLNHFDATESERLYVDALEYFLCSVSRAEGVPLDFLSWQCCTDRPEELSIHSNYAKSYLNQFGLKRTQSIVSAFKIEAKAGIQSAELPALIASAYVIGQKCAVDMMLYDNALAQSIDNPFFAYIGAEKIHLASFGALSAFGTVYSLKNACEVTPDVRGELYSLAATDGKDGALLLVTRNYSGTVEIELKNSPFISYSIKGMLGGGEHGIGFSTELKDAPIENDRILISAGKCEVYLVKFTS